MRSGLEQHGVHRETNEGFNTEQVNKSGNMPVPEWGGGDINQKQKQKHMEDKE